MDEMNMIRDLLPEPADPTAQTMTAAEHRLTAEFDRAPGRTRRLGLRVVLPGLAAAAVAAAVVIGTLVPAGSAHHGREPVALTARQVLLTAATQSAATPVTGKYWLVRTHYGNFFSVGPKAHRYRIVTVFEMADWALRDSTNEWDNVRQLGAKPVSAADRAAWRAAGSPTSWKDPAGSGAPAGYPVPVYHTTPDRTWSGLENQPKAKRSAWSAGQIPNDPAKIRRMLLDAGPGGPGAAVPQPEADMLIFHGATGMLTQATTPAQRETLYKLLAGLPELKVRKNVRDPEGRVGIGVSWNEGGVLLEQVIIDPVTGQTLAFEQITLSARDNAPGSLDKPGDVVDYQSVVSAGWTNQPPR